jgi:menaquinone-dependent protoporphyrinogen IX oxidase
MKVLVCAASKYGATSQIAQPVADVLTERGCQVTVLPPEKVSELEEYISNWHFARLAAAILSG